MKKEKNRKENIIRRTIRIYWETLLRRKKKTLNKKKRFNNKDIKIGISELWLFFFFLSSLFFCLSIELQNNEERKIQKKNKKYLWNGNWKRKTSIKLSNWFVHVIKTESLSNNKLFIRIKRTLSFHAMFIVVVAAGCCC